MSRAGLLDIPRAVKALGSYSGSVLGDNGKVLDGKIIASLYSD